MRKLERIKLELSRDDVWMIITALENRIEAYTKTAGFMRGGESDILIEEVSSAEEAERMADDLQDMLDEIQKQTKTSERGSVPRVVET